MNKAILDFFKSLSKIKFICRFSDDNIIYNVFKKRNSFFMIEENINIDESIESKIEIIEASISKILSLKKENCFWANIFITTKDVFENDNVIDFDCLEIKNERIYYKPFLKDYITSLDEETLNQKLTEFEN